MTGLVLISVQIEMLRDLSSSARNDLVAGHNTEKYYSIMAPTLEKLRRYPKKNSWAPVVQN